MGINPFKSIPYQRFFLRSWKYALAVFFLGLLSVGIVCTSLIKQGGEQWYTIQRAIASSSAEDYKPEPAQSLWPHQALAQLYLRNLQYVFHFPGVCWTGNTVNDLQKQRCNEFWEQWGTELIMASTPFGLVLLFYILIQGMLGGVYSRAYRAIEKKQAQVTGVVTDPALLPRDFFCWFYCLRAISVQLQSGEQVKVYFPESATLPTPGQKVVLFSWGKIHGIKRWVGCLYAPNLVILEGS